MASKNVEAKMAGVVTLFCVLLLAGGMALIHGGAGLSASARSEANRIPARAGRNTDTSSVRGARSLPRDTTRAPRKVRSSSTAATDEEPAQEHTESKDDVYLTVLKAMRTEWLDSINDNSKD